VEKEGRTKILSRTGDIRIPSILLYYNFCKKYSLSFIALVLRRRSANIHHNLLKREGNLDVFYPKENLNAIHLSENLRK